MDYILKRKWIWLRYGMIGLTDQGTVITNKRRLSEGQLKHNEEQEHLSKWEGVVSFAEEGSLSSGKFALLYDGTVQALTGRKPNPQSSTIVWSTGLFPANQNWNNVVSLVSDHNIIAAIHKNGSVSVLQTDASVVPEMNVYMLNNIISLNIYTDLIIGLRKDGTVAVTGNYAKDLSAEYKRWTDITSVLAGFHSVYGLNNEGQVLFDGTAANVTAIKAEVSSWKQVRRLVSRGLLRDIIIGITSNGNVYVRGSKKINEIQILKQQKQVVDVQATLDSFFTLKTDGTVFSTNKAYNTSGWKDVVEIEADQHDVYALCADGTLLHAGSDNYGFADELNSWKLFSDIDEANQKMESFPLVMKKQQMQKRLDQAQKEYDELSEKKSQTKGLFAKKRVETIEENQKKLQNEINELKKQLIH